METIGQLERISLAELRKTIEYQALLPQHKLFVDTLLTLGAESGTFDFLAATSVAYPGSASNSASLAVRSSQVQVHPRVKRVLDMAFGRKPEKVDPVISLLGRALKHAINHDIANWGTLSDATAKSLAIYERQAGKKLKVPANV